MQTTPQAPGTLLAAGCCTPRRSSHMQRLHCWCRKKPCWRALRPSCCHCSNRRLAWRLQDRSCCLLLQSRMQRSRTSGHTGWSWAGFPPVPQWPVPMAGSGRPASGPASSPARACIVTSQESGAHTGCHYCTAPGVGGTMHLPARKRCNSICTAHAMQAITLHHPLRLQPAASAGCHPPWLAAPCWQQSTSPPAAAAAGRCKRQGSRRAPCMQPPPAAGWLAWPAAGNSGCCRGCRRRRRWPVAHLQSMQWARCQQ
jgi:hypothetical protein